MAKSKDLDEIDRQLATLSERATRLEALAFRASEAGGAADALKLQTQAQELRVRQSNLAYKRDQIQVASAEWKSLVASLKKIKKQTDDAFKDLEKIVDVLKTATKIAAIADAILARIGG